DEYILKENSYRELEFGEGESLADLGAHIGVVSRRALAAGSRVIAWEPEPVNVELLRLNLSQVPGTLFEVVPAAVVADDSPEEDVRLWLDADDDGAAGRTALHSLFRGKGPR